MVYIALETVSPVNASVADDNMNRQTSLLFFWVQGPESGCIGYNCVIQQQKFALCYSCYILAAADL